MTDQLELFSSPEAPPRRRAGRRFLTTNATFFHCLAASPTLQAVAARTVKDNARKHGTDRSAATPFEDLLVARLIEADTAAQIAAETIAHPDAAELSLVTVQLEKGPAGSPADLIVRYRTHKERTVAIATNVKRLLPNSTNTEGCSLPAFLRLALDDNYDPANPPSNRGFDFEERIVQWAADQVKICDGRDYYLLVVYADGTTFGGVEGWSVLAGYTNGTPSARRHETRAVLRVRRPDALVPDDADINDELVAQMLPPANLSALRSLLLALLAPAATSDQRAELAGVLAELSPETLYKLVRDVARYAKATTPVRHQNAA
jgi:hypothetical protein